MTLVSKKKLIIFQMEYPDIWINIIRYLSPEPFYELLKSNIIPLPQTDQPRDHESWNLYLYAQKINIAHLLPRHPNGNYKYEFEESMTREKLYIEFTNPMFWKLLCEQCVPNCSSGKLCKVHHMEYGPKYGTTWSRYSIYYMPEESDIVLHDQKIILFKNFTSISLTDQHCFNNCGKDRALRCIYLFCKDCCHLCKGISCARHFRTKKVTTK